MRQTQTTCCEHMVEWKGLLKKRIVTVLLSTYERRNGSQMDPNSTLTHKSGGFINSFSHETRQHTHSFFAPLLGDLCIEKFNSWVIITTTTTTRVMMKPWQQSSNETEHPEQKGKRKYKEIRPKQKAQESKTPKWVTKDFKGTKLCTFNLILTFQIQAGSPKFTKIGLIS